MNHPDLNQLAEEIFEANKAKGFHEVEHSNETLLMLVITKLSEAVEADRKEKRADVKSFQFEIDRLRHPYYYSFNMYIKDSLEDELADAVIRLLDLAGLRNKYVRDDYNSREYSNSFPENIYHIISEFYRLPNLSMKINVTILNIADLCKSLDIDLWLHVELKMKYNATRPYKHGKSY